MKQWTEEDLILLYYQELNPAQTQEIMRAMTGSDSASKALKHDYQTLCQVLDRSSNFYVPKPSSDLNQRVMSAVYYAESSKHQVTQTKQQYQSLDVESTLQKILRWLTHSLGHSARPALIMGALALVGIFYLGRWSVAPIDVPLVHLEQTDDFEQGDQSNNSASRRILLTSVSAHLESSERLFRMVSNGGDTLADDLKPRRQMIEDLISFNRLYRRLAEQSNDAMLVTVLQQMESILLEINHTGDDDLQWQKVRNRLEGTDLLFKLKVTDKKINRELT